MDNNKNNGFNQQKEFILDWYNLLMRDYTYSKKIGEENYRPKELSYLGDFYDIICKIEKKKYQNSNVKADNPNLAMFLEKLYQANRLTVSGELYPVICNPTVLVPSFIVNGNEYLREEENIGSKDKPKMVYYWYVIEPIKMSDVYEEAKSLLNHVNDMLLLGPITSMSNLFLPQMKKEIENIIFYLETNCTEEITPTRK